MSDDKQFSERPPNSDFQQQNLKAWQPLLTPPWVIGTFLVIGIIFIPVGHVILDASNKVKQYTVEYNMSDTSVTIPIEDDFDPDEKVYFYYRLTKFYQNHRRYVKSRSDAQLRGDEEPVTSTCAPLEKSPTTEQVLYPCGLIASSYFNDTFSEPCIYNQSTGGTCTPVNWTDTGIAWESDKKKFKSTTYADTTNIGPNGELPSVTNESFMVWMRTAGLPDFMKLRYIITGANLKKGDYFTVQIDNNFEVSSFGGSKYIVLSTTSWLGGKNEFLGWAYYVVGILCIVFGLAFWIKDKFSPRKLGDMQYFNFSPEAKR